MKSKLKRHEGLLTVIGALIVFATFIVKDTIRERYKEWAESIDSAEVHYKLASELGAANKGIWEANDKVSQALDRLNERKYGAKNRSEVDLSSLMAGFQQEELLEADAEIENLVVIVRKLPQHSSEDGKLAHLKRDLALAKKLVEDRRQQDVETSMIAKTDKNRAEELQRNVDRDEDAIEAEKRNDKEGFGETMIQNLQKEVLAKATAERDKYEHLNDFWRPFSYVLFGLGWSIGLLAKWADIKSEGSAE